MHVRREILDGVFVSKTDFLLISKCWWKHCGQVMLETSEENAHRGRLLNSIKRFIIVDHMICDGVVTRCQCVGLSAKSIARSLGPSYDAIVRFEVERLG